MSHEFLIGRWRCCLSSSMVTVVAVAAEMAFIVPDSPLLKPSLVNAEEFENWYNPETPKNHYWSGPHDPWDSYIKTPAGDAHFCGSKFNTYDDSPIFPQLQYLGFFSMAEIQLIAGDNDD